MGIYYLEGIGLANVGNTTLKCKFKVSSEELFKRFYYLEPILSSGSKRAIAKSIASGLEEKIKSRDEIDDFFAKIQAKLKEEGRTIPS
jgi:hypothetical protein